MQDYIPRGIDINGTIDTVEVRQYDNNSRFIRVKLRDDDLAEDNNTFDLSDCTTALYIRPESGGDVSFISGTVESPSGVVTFLIPGGVTQVVGNYLCQIRIYEGDDTDRPVISSKPFRLTVDESIAEDAAIEATPDYSALTVAMTNFQAVKNQMAALVASPAGSGGDVGTELRDARVGKDQTYSTAGDAVRAAVQGVSAFLGAANFAASPILADFNNLPNNIIRGCGVYVIPQSSSEADDISAGMIKIANAPVTGQMTGLIVTLGRRADRIGGDTQIFIPWHGGTILYRQYNSVSVEQSQTFAWSDWVTGNEEIEAAISELPQFRAGINSAHADYNNLLSRCTKDGFFIANPDNWADLPYNSDGFVIINTKYSNYILQTAVAVTSGLVYNRIVHSTNFTVFHDWEMPDGIDRRLKVLAVGDSICYGGRNNNKGFIGDLGTQNTNKSIVGIRLSERNSSSIPSTRDVESGYFRPSIPRLFDFAVGEEAIPDASAYPSNMQFNANVITSLSAIQLPSGYQPDVIIISGGTNDYIQNAALGVTPTTPIYDAISAVNLDRTTVMGGLQYLFYSMITTYPAAEKFFLIQHKVCSNNVYWVSTDNTAGYSQQDLHDAIVACCRVYGIKVIDVYNDSPLNTIFPEYCSPTSWSSDNSLTDTEYVDNDGIHPMELGYKTFYIPLVKAALKGNTSGNVEYREFIDPEKYMEVLNG